VVDACVAQGRSFFIVALEGHADKELVAGCPHDWVRLGGAAKLADILNREKFQELVMIGSVHKPSFAALKPDWATVKYLARIGKAWTGEDSLLRAIASIIEEDFKIKVIGVQDILGGLVLKKGCITKQSPDEASVKDIDLGIAVAKNIGRADIGQSVVIQDGIVLCVEAFEGTDEVIRRAGELKQKRNLDPDNKPRGVLVKTAKPQQDSRLDLPTIGINTVNNVIEAGLSGIAIQAGKSLIIDIDSVRKLADEAGIFIVGV